MAQTCLTVDMSPPRICERGPSPSGLDNIFGSLRMGALVRASVPLPSRACRGAQGGGLRGVGSRVCAVPSMKALPASGPDPQDRRGLSTGIPRPRKNPRSEMQGVIPGDPKAWVLPLKPPSSPRQWWHLPEADPGGRCLCTHRSSGTPSPGPAPRRSPL